MSRSGYSDDLDNWTMIKWRGVISSATRGRRGQVFFKTLVEALDAMPDKRLVTSELRDESGCMCTLGALAVHRGMDPDTMDTQDHEALGKAFDVAHQLTQEVMYENDEGGHWKEDPERRWQRIRDWAASQISKNEREVPG